ncbi:HupE/UreJ family protein [Pendulispora brunnea]|uniref:HupE/UreJ family protein n=1 Tax=Pendulispora brunnea TaxID=2905690 RepID=A0ABZ2JZ31_9BACT
MDTVIKVLFALLALVALLVATPAAAHDFNPGVLTLVEVREGRFDIAWTEPVDSLGTGHVRIGYPPQCHREGDHLACGREGLRGELTFEGLHARRTRIVVTVRYLDGDAFDAVVTSDEPRVRIDKAPHSEIASQWIRLGAEHVYTGLDHVAFVVGLFLITGAQRRRLLATITAFTVAHSLTLALAALHILELPRAPVEAAIAASVVLVAYESTHDEKTFTRRYPWAVAFGFGLVHGLGFAGALGELSLPRGAFGVALASFNVGVELAQLSIVGALLALAWLARARLSDVRQAMATRAVSLVLGAFGAYWFFDRAYLVLNR